MTESMPDTAQEAKNLSLRKATKMRKTKHYCSAKGMQQYIDS